MAIDLQGVSITISSDDLIKRAKTRQNELAKEKASKLREKINAMVKAEGFGLDDVFGRNGGAARRARKVKPKYRNPADPARPGPAAASVHAGTMRRSRPARRKKTLLIG